MTEAAEVDAVDSAVSNARWEMGSARIIATCYTARLAWRQYLRLLDYHLAGHGIER